MSFQIAPPLMSMFQVMRNSVSPASTPPKVPTRAWISDWIELLLITLARGGRGPTHITRWMMLFSNILYNSYQYVTADTSAIDTEYFTEKGKRAPLIGIQDDASLQAWMEAVCQYVIPKLIKEDMSLPLPSSEFDALVASHSSANALPSLGRYASILDAYRQARDQDGWRQTNIFQGALPNGNAVVLADNSAPQDLRTLPEPSKWTPLSLNGVTRNYLTPEWGTVNRGILSEEVAAEMRAQVDELFPDEAQFQKEMQEVASVTSSLTSEGKMIAEYWAGGPGSVSPPGMWMVMLDVVIRSNGFSLREEIRFYTILAAGLYEAGIHAWRLKRDHLQARPVQVLRQQLYGEPIDLEWDEQKSGEYWLPYQALNFVTPPFPDFVSGHSTFSMTAARLFCCLLRSDQIVLENPMITLDILNYFSPILAGTTTLFSINSVMIRPKKSEIQPGVEPTTGVCLGWSTWSEMALSSGRSRIFGGIHVESSNQGGLLLGRLIADRIWDKMRLL